MLGRTFALAGKRSVYPYKPHESTARICKGVLCPASCLIGYPGIETSVLRHATVTHLQHDFASPRLLDLFLGIPAQLQQPIPRKDASFIYWTCNFPTKLASLFICVCLSVGRLVSRSVRISFKEGSYQHFYQSSCLLLKAA